MNDDVCLCVCVCVFVFFNFFWYEYYSFTEVVWVIRNEMMLWILLQSVIEFQAHLDMHETI